MARNFRNIKAWQHAQELVLECYTLSKKLPNSENYNLVSQIRRAAVSVPANIAEGSAKNSKKDYFRFLMTARGSLTELEYLLELCKNLNYITPDYYDKIETLRLVTVKVLQGLIKAVNSEIQEEKQLNRQQTIDNRP